MGRGGELIGLGVATGAAGVALAEAHLANTVLYNHGYGSHRANGVSPQLAIVGDYLNWSLGTSLPVWVGPHTNSVVIEWDGDENHLAQFGHHGLTDMSLKRARDYEVFSRIKERWPRRYENYPDLPPDTPIPNFDPYANLYRSEIRLLGSYLLAIMDGLLGGEHVLPEHMSIERVRGITDITREDFRYSKESLVRPKSLEDLTVEALTDRLGRDSYSPSLANLDESQRNGVYAVHKNNVAYFRSSADVYALRPDLLADWIREVPVRSPNNKLGLAVFFGGAAALGGLIGATRRGKGLPLLAYSLAGLGVAGIGTRGPVEGGALTNAIGHMGETTVEGIIEATFFNRPYEIIPNKDGSVTTTVYPRNMAERIFLQLLGLTSADEIPGQFAHHFAPGDRRYSLEELEALARKSAPVTHAIRSASQKSRFGLRPAPGFGEQYENNRPDVANPVVSGIIWPARVATMQGLRNVA